MIEVLILLFHSFSFILWSAGKVKSTILQVLFFFFLLIIIRSGLLGEIRWSVWMSWVIFKDWCWVLHIPFVLKVKFKFLAQLPVDHLPTLSCLDLYSFCDNLLHSLIMWLIVSSLSPHSIHLLFCCVFPILASIWLALMALFCVACRRDFRFSVKVSFS